MWKELWDITGYSGSQGDMLSWPIRSRILKGPMYRGLSFPHFPNRMTPLRACKRCRICTTFLVVSWIISGPDSCMIKSLRLPKSGNQLRFLIHRVPLGRISNDLSIPLDDSLILSQSSSSHFETDVGQLVIYPGVMVNDSYGVAPGIRSIWNSTWRTGGRLVLSQMAHLVTSITLNSARSCVMQSAFLTQGTVSNIPIVFSWSDSIRPEGFLSSVLLWLVIIVAVVGVGVTVVVVESSSVVKLSFVIT
ncbi:hypothetical protein Tco_0336476 [Tanacetum coccineum]